MMEIKKYEHDGKNYRELISPEYAALSALKREYEKIGKKTWINLYDMERWVLTVLDGTNEFLPRVY